MIVGVTSVVQVSTRSWPHVRRSDPRATRERRLLAASTTPSWSAPGVDVAGHAGTESAVAGIDLGGDLRWYLLVLVTLAEKYGYARTGGR